jgi:hypothetical protein
MRHGLLGVDGCHARRRDQPPLSWQPQLGSALRANGRRLVSGTDGSSRQVSPSPRSGWILVS